MGFGPETDRWLDDIAQVAQGSQGRSLWCALPSGLAAQLTAALQSRLTDHRIPVLSVNLASRIPAPWQPFQELVQLGLAALPPATARKLVRQAFPFRPEYQAMLSWAGLGTQGGDPGEPPIPEEKTVWRMLAPRGISRLVHQLLGGQAMVLVCHGAEFLPPESLALMERFDGDAKLPLVVVNCFHHNPGACLPRLATQFRLLDSRASLHRIGELPWMERLPPLGDADLPRLQHLLDLHCPSSAETWLAADLGTWESELKSDGGAPGYLVTQLQFLLARSLVEQERLEEALTAIQAAWMELDAELSSRQALPVLELMSWIQFANSDATAAARTAWQAWVLAKKLDDRTWQARACFAFMRTKQVDSQYADLLSDLEVRLEADFVQLRWDNHLAFMLCLPATVILHGDGDEVDEAQRRCDQARAICQGIGNYRRLANAWHMLALLAQRRQQWTEAEKLYRRSRRIMERWAPPHELARSYNGLGYYYFIRGQYDAAQHQFELAMQYLVNSTLYDESLQTLVNQGRVQLWSAAPSQALQIFETIISVLDQLGQVHLPLQPRKNLLAFLGIAAFKSALAEQSQEIGQRLTKVALRGDEGNQDLPVLWFSALQATRLPDPAVAREAFARAEANLTHLAAGERTGLVQVMLDHAEWLLSIKCHQEALGMVEKASRLIDDDGFPLEHQRIDAIRLNQPPPAPVIHRRAGSNPIPLLQLVERQRMLGQLRRSLKDSDFLRRWQEMLARVRPEEQLRHTALRLIRQRWLVEHAAITRPGSVPDSALAPIFREADARGWDSPRASTDNDVPAVSGLEAWSWIPIQYDGVIHWGLAVGTARRGLDFGPAAHQHLALACHQLATILMVIQREEHLSRSERLAGLGSLVAGISHEINTPLGIAVTGSSYLVHLARELLDAHKESQLSKAMLETELNRIVEGGQLVLRNLEQAERLIRSFKMVSSDQASEARRSFCLVVYLREIVASLSSRLAEKQVIVSLQGPEDLELDSFPGAIYQIVTNLVINCVFHGFADRTGGHIDLEVEQHGGQITLRVRDDGKGIAAAILPRIFNPFFTTRRGQGGTGLGLHIVHNLVEQVLDGTIEAESQPGQGTCFTITIPRITPHMEPS